MFLAKIIEEQKDKRYNDVHGFVDDFTYIPKAVRGTNISITLLLIKYT